MYEVVFAEKVNYTEIIVSGERTFSQREDGIKSWITISDYTNKNKLTRILLISKLTGEIDSLSSYDIASALDYFGISKQLKIAFVEVDEASRNVNSFTGQYAQRRGFNIEVFEKIVDGLSWLLK